MLLFGYSFYYVINTVPSDCNPGYFGKNCRGKCSYPYYGEECQGQCNCDKERCDVSIGCTNVRKGIASYINSIFQRIIGQLFFSWHIKCMKKDFSLNFFLSW